jgi:hypothetical protein
MRRMYVFSRVSRSESPLAIVQTLEVSLEKRSCSLLIYANKVGSPVTFDGDSQTSVCEPQPARREDGQQQNGPNGRGLPGSRATMKRVACNCAQWSEED